MRTRLGWSGVVTIVVGTALWASLPALAQTTPRTPWGDPDLQGTYSNTQENGTPFERPKEFAGRTLADITPAELRQQRRAIQERTIGAFQGPIHAPDHWWQANLDLERGGQAWLVTDPQDGQIPALTPQAQRRAAARTAARSANTRGPADSWTDRSLYDRCITRGYPGSMLPSIYGNMFEIVQGPGVAAIRYEMIHETRVIPIGDGPHTSAAIGLDMGNARGHWEGDTLVVETRHFKDRSVYRNANPATLTIVERFTRISPAQVRWTVTLTDPDTWTQPWTYSLPLTRDAEPVPAYDCHEGNYSMPNILSAARAEERDAARTGRRVTSDERPGDGEASAPAEGR